MIKPGNELKPTKSLLNVAVKRDYVLDMQKDDSEPLAVGFY